MMPRIDGRAVVVVAAVGAVVALVGSIRFHIYTDLEVYRLGGQAWWRGLALYRDGWDHVLGGRGLPFTYPPVAAVLFVVLYALGTSGALVVLTGLGVLATVATCLVVVPPRLSSAARARPVTSLVVGSVLVGLLEPVRMTISFGQVNLVLMGLVAVDCLVPRTRWPRGALVGLAAAIKLTPVVFVLFFLVGRRWRQAGVAVLSFLVVTGIGWLAAPTDSVDFWTRALFDPARIGGLGYGANQSWQGVLWRVVPGGVPGWWITVVLFTSVLAVIGARRLIVRGAEVPALLVIASAALLISPISWSHHWVWAVPALVWLVGRRAWWSAASVGAVFYLAPHWSVTDDTTAAVRWTWEHAVGNAYVAVAVVSLVLAACLPDRVAGVSRRVISIEPAPSSGRAGEAMKPAAS
jgi:alpha-1,2-mannosyltransferase